VTVPLESLHLLQKPVAAVSLVGGELGGIIHKWLFEMAKVILNVPFLLPLRVN